VVEKVGRKWVSGYFTRKGLALPKQYSPGKSVTTDKTAMAALVGVPVIEAIQDYRESTKLLNTYLLAFPKYMNGGRLHGNFNATGTVTGRASSDHQNLQNIPARAKYAGATRALFIPAEKKCFVIGDLDQIEYRLAAWFSQEPVMIDAFKAGEDIHTATATQVLGRRPKDKRERTVFGKNINFGELFGFGLKKFIAMAAAGGFTLTNVRAKEIMETFKAKMPKVQEWKQDVVQEARVMGYIEMPSGRRRNLPNINHPDPAKRFGAERQAVNTYCQGTAADLLKMITVLMYRKGWVPVLTVHDELVFECAPFAAGHVTEALHNAVDEAADILGITRRLPNRLDVPVTMNVVTAKDWSEKA
jgi:DNA polymerase-1